MAAVLVGILFIVVGFALIASGSMERKFGDSDFDLFAKVAAPILMLMAGGGLLGSSYGTVSKTMINLYDDHVEGVGLINNKPQAFYFQKYQNYTLLKQGSQLCVFCDGVGYNIPLSAADISLFINASR